MGINYSESCAPCLGARQKNASLYDRMWDNWQHETYLTKQSNVLVSHEEAYMIKK